MSYINTSGVFLRQVQVPGCLLSSGSDRGERVRGWEHFLLSSFHSDTIMHSQCMQVNVVGQ